MTVMHSIECLFQQSFVILLDREFLLMHTLETAAYSTQCLLFIDGKWKIKILAEKCYQTIKTKLIKINQSIQTGTII